MKFESDVVIGLEVHAELDTKSKLFCGSPRTGNDIPNSRVCPICLGHPGSKPVLNKKALELGLKIGISLGCKISDELLFSRKSYFYPDMSKNFQITQFEKPLGEKGKIKISDKREIAITRVHLEEDPAALSYPKGMHSSNYVLIDYNRAGNPLVEIVTEPVIVSPAEAREFLNQLVSILTYLGAYDVNNCTLKTDANISIKESGYTRVEIKNISGFKEVERALSYEMTRQKIYVKRGAKIKRETRGWDETSKTTKSLRSKETEEDYGYIVEPDLSIIDIEKEKVVELTKRLPELAYQKAERLCKQYGIDKVNAWIIAKDKLLADIFEKVCHKIDSKLVSRWFREEILRILNYNEKTIDQVYFGEKELIELLTLLHSGKISERTAKKIMEEMATKKISPKQYVSENELDKITSEIDIIQICKKVVETNEKAVKDYLAGEQKSFEYLMGQVIRLAKFKADPTVCRKILKEMIGK